MSPRAENKMGRWGAVSYFVGNIVGSGIFIVPSTVVQNTGSVGLALLIFPVLSAAIALLGAFCYVELGTCIRRSGGDFAYLCHVRWNAVAFMFMAAGCIIIYPIMLAVQAETFAEYVVQGLRVVACVSETHEFLLRKLFSFLVVWLILFLNFFSTRRYGARFQIWSSLAKLLSTGVIVGTAAYLVLFKGQTQNFRDPFANSTLEPAKLVNAFFAGLFSFDGWDVLNFGAEEVENPRSTMVFAIIVGMLCVTTIYATINISYFVVLDALQVRQSTAVAMSFAEQSLGHFQNLMPFLINLVMIGALNGTMFTASRYLFAAARQRHLPSFIALVNVEHDSPRAAVVTHTLLAFFISFLGNIDQLINYLGFAQWLQRGFTMGALLWIRLGPGRHILHPDGIRTPLIMPIAFLLICLTLVGVTLFQDFDTAKYGLMVLAVALAVHCIFVWEQSLSRFSCYRQMASQLNDWFARITQLVLNGQIDVSSPEEQEEEIDAETFVEKRRAATLTISHGLGPAADHQQTSEKEKGNKVFPVDGEGQRRRQKRLAAVNGDGPTANGSS